MRSLYKGTFKESLFHFDYIFSRSPLFQKEVPGRLLVGRRRQSVAGRNENRRENKRTVVLPSTGEEAEITAVTVSGNESQAFNSLHPMVQSTHYDWSLIT